MNHAGPKMGILRFNVSAKRFNARLSRQVSEEQPGRDVRPDDLLRPLRQAAPGLRAMRADRVGLPPRPRRDLAEGGADQVLQDAANRRVRGGGVAPPSKRQDDDALAPDIVVEDVTSSGETKR
jgi:hypothetical protein